MRSGWDNQDSKAGQRSSKPVRRRGIFVGFKVTAAGLVRPVALSSSLTKALVFACQVQAFKFALQGGPLRLRDWLDTPGAVVKKRVAVPGKLSVDVATGAAAGGSNAPSPLLALPGFDSFLGTLWPFAANALPNAVSAPPPAALTWQRPQASLVC
jgi:hypothetical protein